MSIKFLRTQVKNDLKLIGRDSFLRIMVFVPLIAAILIRLLLPLIQENVQLGINIYDYELLLVSFVYGIIMSSILGMLTGFLLLDEKDEGTLHILKVTPLQPIDYLKNKMVVPAVLGIGLNLIAIPLTGIEVPPIHLLLLVLFLGSFWAPIFALLLSTYANNKVEGLAMAKLFGVLFLVPLVAYFVPTPFQWTFGIIPSYWPVKLFWMISDPTSSILLILGIFILSCLQHLVVIYVLATRFENKIFD